MNKKTIVYEAPVLNRSGYGAWSDDIFHCLDTMPNIDLKVANVGWGSCVQRRSKTVRDERILAKILREQLKAKPDVHITQTIPHISNPQGKVNVNISAGIEVDKCYDQIIEGLNRHDLNIVPSQFAKDVYLNSNKKCVKPIEVVPWCYDNIPYPAAESVEQEMAKIKEDEAFLFIGQYTSYQIFNDRKDIGNLVKTFLETFKGYGAKPALILKTNGVNFGYADRNVILDKIAHIKKAMGNHDFPNVYVLHGELNEAELWNLINHKKIIAHVSFTHAEGFGHPLLQASMSGKPVFAPNYSAQTEFLTNSPLLEGEAKVIPADVVSEYFIAGSKWFNVDYQKAGIKLKDFYYSDRTELNAKAAELAKVNIEKYSLAKMAYRLQKVLNKYI